MSQDSPIEAQILPTKVCADCKNLKTLDNFGKDKNRKDGLNCYCKKCLREYREGCKLSKAAYDKIRKVTHADENRVNKRKWYAANEERNWNKHLLNTYGIDSVRYYEILESQNGCCAICSKHKSLFKKRLHVDHCHTKGKVRGLLCGSCNLGIGKLGDTYEGVQKAAEYLRDNG